MSEHYIYIESEFRDGIIKRLLLDEEVSTETVEMIIFRTLFHPQYKSCNIVDARPDVHYFGRYEPTIRKNRMYLQNRDRKITNKRKKFSVEEFMMRNVWHGPHPRIKTYHDY